MLPLSPRVAGPDFWPVSDPGCASQGETRAQAVHNIKEAIDLYLWSLKEDGMPLPKRNLEFETVRIAAPRR